MSVRLWNPKAEAVGLVMLPRFNEQGYLPPGVHDATMDELAERFGQESELQRVEMESIRWLVELSRRAGVLRIVVNGSFVADTYEPNDVETVTIQRLAVTMGGMGRVPFQGAGIAGRTTRSPDPSLLNQDGSGDPSYMMAEPDI